MYKNIKMIMCITLCFSLSFNNVLVSLSNNIVNNNMNTNNIAEKNASENEEAIENSNNSIKMNANENYENNVDKYIDANVRESESINKNIDLESDINIEEDLEINTDTNMTLEEDTSSERGTCEEENISEFQYNNKILGLSVNDNATFNGAEEEPKPTGTIRVVPFHFSEVLDIASDSELKAKDGFYRILFLKSNHPDINETYKMVDVQVGDPVIFPSIKESELNDRETFHGWENANRTFNLDMTSTDDDKLVYKDFCTGVGDDKSICFYAKIETEPLYVINFHIDQRYYDINDPTVEVPEMPLSYGEVSAPFPVVLNSKILGATFSHWESAYNGKIVKAGDTIKIDDTCFDENQKGANVIIIHFDAVFEEKNINIKFENVLPDGATGPIEGENVPITVLGRTPSEIDYNELTLEGFKHEGWSNTENGEVVWGTDKNLMPTKFLEPGKTEYTLYSVFKKLDIERKKKPKPNPVITTGGSGGGTGGGSFISQGGGSSYLQVTNWFDNQGRNCFFEYVPELNMIKFGAREKNGEKTYITNQWICLNNDNKVDWYLTNASGKILSGFVFYNNSFYYLSETPYNSGKLVTGEVVKDGVKFFFDNNGKCILGYERIPSYEVVENNANKMFTYNYNTEDIVFAMNDTERNIKINDEESNGKVYPNLIDPDIYFYDEDGTTLLHHLTYQDAVKYYEDSDSYEFNINYEPEVQHDKRFLYWVVQEDKSLIQNGDVVIAKGGISKLVACYEATLINIEYYTYNFSSNYEPVLLFNDVALKDSPYELIKPIGMERSRYKLAGYTTLRKGTTAEYHVGSKLKFSSNITLYPVWEPSEIFKYISDVVVADKKSKNSAKNALTSRGYTVIDQDLNEGAGGHYIYMGYKLTDKKEDAITDFIACYYEAELEVFIKEHISPNGFAYDIVKDTGGGMAEFNNGAGGDFVYMYYTKDNRAGNPIIKLDFKAYDYSVSESDFLSHGFSIVHDYLRNHGVMDFNEDAGGKWIYGLYTPYTDYYDLDPEQDLSRIDGTNWMKKIPGDRPLFSFNIPGTHDSGTRLLYYTKKTHAQCQDLSFLQQLSAGARVFDCRLGCYRSHNNFYHGGMDFTDILDALGHDRIYIEWAGLILPPIRKMTELYLTIKEKFAGECECYEDWQAFRDHVGRLSIDSTIRNCINFVSQHPSETVILKLRYETKVETEYRDKMIELINYYKTSGRLYIENRVPTLAEVRGKVVIMDGGWNNEKRKLGYGIHYQDPAYFDPIFEEDHCGVESGPKKIILQDVFEGRTKIDDEGNTIKIYTLEETAKLNASNNHKPIYYCVSLNCYGTSAFPYPGANASNVNGWFREYGKNFAKGKQHDGYNDTLYFGVINFDFIDDQLASLVYLSNFKYERKIKK